MTQQTPNQDEVVVEKEDLFYYNYSNDDFFTEASPVDYHALNKDVVMPAPHNATLTPVPTSIPSDKWPKYRKATDDWELVDNFKDLIYWDADGKKFQIVAYGIKPPEDALYSDPGPTLEALRAKKIEELTKDHSIAKYQPVGYTTVGGVISSFQANDASVNRMVSELIVFDATDELPDGYFWVASDNQHVPFEKEDLRGLLVAIQVRNFRLFEKLQTLKALTREADKKDLEDIAWSDD